MQIMAELDQNHEVEVEQGHEQEYEPEQLVHEPVNEVEPQNEVGPENEAEHENEVEDGNEAEHENDVEREIVVEHVHEIEKETEPEDVVIENSQPDAKQNHADESVVGGGERWPGWPGESIFRMLVPAQKVGTIIGRKGEYIKKTCEETKARIKILDGPPGTRERAVSKFLI